MIPYCLLNSLERHPRPSIKSGLTFHLSFTSIPSPCRHPPGCGHMLSAVENRLFSTTLKCHKFHGLLSCSSTKTTMLSSLPSASPLAPLPPLLGTPPSKPLHVCIISEAIVYCLPIPTSCLHRNSGSANQMFEYLGYAKYCLHL